jgi:alanyl aminopeptidase
MPSAPRIFRFRHRPLASCLLIAALATQVAQAGDSPPTGKLPPDATPLSYVLNLKIDPREERFGGQVRVRVRLTKAANHVWLHARDLAIDRVVVTDSAGKTAKARFAIRDPSGVAEVSFAATLPAQEIELAIDYSAPFSPQQFQGLYKAKVGDDVYAITQMEAVSARYAFPGFDEPRFKTPFDVTLTVPRDETAIANTRQVREVLSADARWKTLTFAKTKPLPTYLLAIAVGPWDVVEAPALPPNAVRNVAVPLRAIGPRGTAPQLRWILGETPAIVTFYENYTAQPYPFDKLDLLGSAGFLGAMENAGLIIFQDILLRVDENSSARIHRVSFNVTAHEVAHQWFGDLVTVPWWDDIWLNEAFATWAQQKETGALKPEFLGDASRTEDSLGAMQDDSLLSARRIRQPIKGQGDIENAFDSITYEKGAAVLHMVEEWLGEDTYRDAMRRYLAEHAYGSGSSEDLIATIARVSGKGDALKSAMHSFLDQPGVPLVHAKLNCTNGNATMALSQSRYLPYAVSSKDNLQWSIPVCARFGRNDASTRQCFLLDQRTQEFAVEGGCADWYMPNADAAGYYRFTMADRDFTALRSRIGTLPPVEQMIFADAVSSAFKRGELAPGTLLDTMPALAASSLPQVATALFEDFTWIHRYLANTATRPALDAFAMKMYGPRMAELGYRRRSGEADAATRLRARLVEFLALTVRDRDVRKILNEQGRAALGLDTGGKVDLSRADPDLLNSTLRTTVQESGQPAFDAVLGELKINHQSEQRRELIAALGSTRDANLAERALDYGLTPDTAVEETFPLFRAHYSEPENGASFWQWFQAHYGALKARLPDQAQSFLTVMAASGRCRTSQADELQRWFAPRIKDIVGGERSLAQSLETIGQCAALREHVGEAKLGEWEGQLNGTVQGQ